MNDAALRSELTETIQVAEYLQANIGQIRQVADVLIAALRDGHRILLCGNGGSAVQAQHFTAELVGRFRTERRPLPALALTAESATLTAIANDYAYETVFARQVEAFGTTGDVLIGLSTSGNSANILAALDAARRLGLITVGLTGRDGGEMRNRCDHGIFLPQRDTARIQEGHLMIIHLLCECIDQAFTERPSD